MRDSLFPQFYCNAKVLRTDMRVNYFEVSNTMCMSILVRSYNLYTFQTLTDDEKICWVPYVIPLTGDLLQTYNNMDHPLCADIAFYKAFRVKILSKSFANDTDTQRFLCYTDRMILTLELIEVRMTNRYNVSLTLCMLMMLHRDYVNQNVRNLQTHSY